VPPLRAITDDLFVDEEERLGVSSDEAGAQLDAVDRERRYG
jgi:hypothetical protein